MKKIGRYDVIGELGRGAMAIVYKAADRTIGRQVALKVLSFDSSADEGTHSPQEMFMREVRAAGRLAHPSIVTIHDAFEDAETKSSCIVMELVPGKTLESILLSGRVMTVEQTLDLVCQVAEGLDYAHRHQVVHRDLKPANILVTEDGRIKITDFGIAKVLAREGVVRTVGVMGTPSYMAPEQVKGGETDARADLFSLGIILFLMLTGQKPFAGDTVAVMFKIVYENPALPSSINPLLTPAHDYVVLKCLAKDCDKRYSSARELLNDLDDLRHGRQPRSRAAAVPAPAPSPQAPHPPATVDPTLATAEPILAATAAKQPAPRVSQASKAPTSPAVAAQPPQPVVPRPVQAVGGKIPVTPGAMLRKNIKIKIMAVDDEPPVLDLLKILLESLSCEVHTITGSREAAERLEVEKIDGLFVDCRMPHMDGFELTKLVRKSKLNRQVPIVMLTGLDDAETMRKGFDVGINFFLGKPFTRERVYNLFNATRGAMLREKLRHIRLPYRTTVECTCGPHNEFHFKSTSLDIGEDGIWLNPSGGLTLGQELDLSFSLPDHPQGLKFHARVVRKVPPDGVGLMFLSLDAREKEALQRYIITACTED
jgi:serine/threonine protein kinase/CheY-like chemotaxis protein